MESEPANSTEPEWNDKAPKDTWRNYFATGRLAIILAGVTFCVLLFSFQQNSLGIFHRDLTCIFRVCFFHDFSR